MQCGNFNIERSIIFQTIEMTNSECKSRRLIEIKTERHTEIKHKSLLPEYSIRDDCTPANLFAISRANREHQDYSAVIESALKIANRALYLEFIVLFLRETRLAAVAAD